MTYAIMESDTFKLCRSNDYNYNFSKKNGYFERWGKTKEDDPEYCGFGPEIVDIEISTICHQGCQHCYKSNTPNGKNMTFDTFKIIFDKLPNTITQIAFGIGDIGANPYLWKIMAYCREKGVIPNITINGDGLTDEIVGNLAKYCGAVAISHYDDDVCFNAIKRLSNAGLKQININNLWSEQTWKDGFRLLDILRRQKDIRLAGLNAVVFLTLKQKGLRNTYTPVKGRVRYKALIRYALNHNLRIGMDSCAAALFAKAIEDRPDKDKLLTMVDSCESTCMSVYVNVDGIMYPCSFAEGLPQFKGINLLEVQDFVKDAWMHPETTDFRTNSITSKDKNGCRNCQIYNLGG